MTSEFQHTAEHVHFRGKGFTQFSIRLPPQMGCNAQNFSGGVGGGNEHEIKAGNKGQKAARAKNVGDGLAGQIVPLPGAHAVSPPLVALN